MPLYILLFHNSNYRRRQSNAGSSSPSYDEVADKCWTCLLLGNNKNGEETTRHMNRQLLEFFRIKNLHLSKHRIKKKTCCCKVQVKPFPFAALYIPTGHHRFSVVASPPCKFQFFCRITCFRTKKYVDRNKLHIRLQSNRTTQLRNVLFFILRRYCTSLLSFPRFDCEFLIFFRSPKSAQDHQAASDRRAAIPGKFIFFFKLCGKLNKYFLFIFRSNPGLTRTTNPSSSSARPMESQRRRES